METVKGEEPSMDGDSKRRGSKHGWRLWKGRGKSWVDTLKEEEPIMGGNSKRGGANHGWNL